MIRLFRTKSGLTVVGHVRRRRLRRAGHCSRSSTMSIPAVAAAVSIGELQSFNKASRRELGASPCTLRTRRRTAVP
ncbi:helix-turn-helix domain-containing protein [Amycolatopsis sp. NPDC026612]|uniref:helix-turn-helix domain-containing protein n=1 Tax=Amycolatopsis sp. NPDC026612 TaxID=3155466 RepID=UPI0033DCD580